MVQMLQASTNKKTTPESVDHQNVNSGTHVQTEPELNTETPKLRSNRTRRPPVCYGTCTEYHDLRGECGELATKNTMFMIYSVCVSSSQL